VHSKKNKKLLHYVDDKMLKQKHNYIPHIIGVPGFHNGGVHRGWFRSFQKGVQGQCTGISFPRSWYKMWN